MDFDDHFYIDGIKFGSKSRFANHSCFPNASLEVVIRAEKQKLAIALITTKTIKQDEEITINYGWIAEIGKERVPCFCGSSKCTGFLESVENPWEPRVLQKPEAKKK